MLASNMSCVDVMYQSYASYFPYQRPTAASPVDSFKKFGSLKHDPSSLEVSSNYSSHSASSLTSLPGGPHGGSSGLHHGPTASPPLSGPGSAGDGSGSGGGGGGSGGHLLVTKVEDSPQDRQHPHSRHQPLHHSDKDPAASPLGPAHSGCGSGSSGGGGGGSSGSSSSAAAVALTPHNAQYLSTNCVLFTYYAGDVAAHVDEHFTRALSQGQSSASPSSASSAAAGYGAEGAGSSHNSKSSSSWKATSPMAQRNFPASFWNSSYQQAASSSLSHPEPLGALHSASSDAYMTSSLHSMSSLGSDPWRYSLTSQTHSVPYAHSHAHNVHDMAYAATMSGTSRFQPHYGSLLGSSRLGSVAGQCDLGKHSMESPWSSRYHPDSLAASNLAGHHDTTHHLHSAITAGGIEPPVQETSKDLYWF